MAPFIAIYTLGGIPQTFQYGSTRRATAHVHPLTTMWWVVVDRDEPKDPPPPAHPAGAGPL